MVQLGISSRDALRFARDYPEKFSRALLPAANAGAVALASAVAESQFGGDPLNVRSGMLRASVTSRVVKVGDSIVAAIGVIRGPATAYARKLEEGGEIRAKPGKALAVPLPAALTASGRPRYPGGPRQAAQRHPGDVFMLKRRGKPPLIVRVRRVAGRKNQPGKARVKAMELLFVLVKSVFITPTNWLSEGVLLNADKWAVAFEQRMERELFSA